MNIIRLRERMKHDLLASIGKYEKEYKVPVFVTSAVISEIMNEVKAAEMQEMLRGEENARRAETGEKQSGYKEKPDGNKEAGTQDGFKQQNSL